MALFLLVLVVLLMVVAAKPFRKPDNELLDALTAPFFPELPIPAVEVRKDTTTNKPVSRGSITKLGGNLFGFQWGNVRNPYYLNASSPQYAKYERFTFREFQKALQCAPSEPAIAGKRAVVEMMRALPPTRSSFELLAAWAQTGCTPWAACRRKVMEFKKAGESSPRDAIRWIGPKILIRIRNGLLSFDWPWKTNVQHGKRSGGGAGGAVEEPVVFDESVRMFEVLIRTISDLGDSVFLIGGEIPSLPSNSPFPVLSYSTGPGFNDIPYPWYVPENKLNKEYIVAFKNNNFSYEFFSSQLTKSKNKELTEELPWAKRVSKAVVNGQMTAFRHFIYDLAVLHPDVFEAASWTFGTNVAVESWNPMSDENPHELHDIYLNRSKGEDDISGYTADLRKDPAMMKPGFNKFISGMQHYGDSRMFWKCKYVVVLSGQDGRATADRLHELLVYSGAVVLLTDHGLEYTYSARLVPWVHYVPLAYNGADVVAKIKWLREHDEDAHRIAENGRNFGKSYLRLEDYYCYLASTLKVIGEIEAGTDATEPFEQ